MAAIKLIGGSGFIGRHVRANLLAAGHDVADPEHVDFDIARENPSQLAAKLTGDEVVINCAGLARDGRLDNLTAVNAEGPRRLAEACKIAGVKRLVHISALGAGAGDATRFQSSKGEGESALAAVEGLEVVIVRPSLVMGAGGASGDFFSALAALPLPPRFGDGRFRVQPLHVTELAEAIARLALAKDPPRRVDAVGPKPIGADVLTERLRDWLGLKPAPFLPLSLRVLKLAAWANEIVEFGPGDRELLALLQRGNVGDPAAIAATLGRQPRSFDESLALRPATIADLWRARLYFLRPLMRLSLALLWIGTGVVSFGLFPPTEFFVMLGELGLVGPPAEIALFGAATLNVALGLLLIVNWRPARVAQAMLTLLVIFSVATLMLPHEYWLTPFAPVLKNLPIGVALLTFIAMEPPVRGSRPAAATAVPASSPATFARAR